MSGDNAECALFIETFQHSFSYGSSNLWFCTSAEFINEDKAELRVSTWCLRAQNRMQRTRKVVSWSKKLLSTFQTWTRLDVYKRQLLLPMDCKLVRLWCQVKLLLRKSEMLFRFRIFRSVLDVYKRQIRTDHAISGHIKCLFCSGRTVTFILEYFVCRNERSIFVIQL